MNLPGIKTFILACFAITECVQALNYGNLNFRNYVRTAPVLPADPQPRPIARNDTSQGPSFSVTNPFPRKFGSSYTIIYPLTFTSNRGAKNLNLTLQSQVTPTDEVQSRIMNNPQLYPKFTYDVPAIEKDLPVEPSPPKAPPSVEYNDFKNPRGPSPSRLKDSQLLPPPPQRYDKGLNFFTYQQQQRRQNNKVPPVPPKPEDRLNYVAPSQGYVKNPKVPKAKTPPLQVYNKATVVASVPPSPVPSPYKIQQQWSSCVCVPYYLCKNGVINSGGRLRANQKRKARSLNYSYGNKTIPTFPVPSKIVNIYPNERTSRQTVCESGKVCCQTNFADNIDDEDDGNYYPVATPPPESPYPLPPRFPSSENDNNVCGVRPVYGVQSRVKQLQYTADVAEFGEYPWQAAILKKVVGDKNLYLCGGVLISPQWVATVAHCVKKDKSSPLMIRLGEWDVNRKDEIYPYVEKDVIVIVVHPDFNPESLENDLALIKMQDPVDSRLPHITPACIPSPGQIYDGQKCWVSGWGKDFFGPQGAYQNVLKEVDVPVVSRALCSTELRSTNLGPNFVLHPGFLCAGGEAGKDACTGDGGSPLVCKSNGVWSVVGLVSWGIGCGQPGVPGVYVNVLYYTDWINSITRR